MDCQGSDIKLMEPLGSDSESKRHDGNHRGSDIERAIDNSDYKSVGPIQTCCIRGKNFKRKDELERVAKSNR